MKTFSLILAVDDKNGIGKDGDLAWRIPEDMKYFQSITTHTQDKAKQNAVVMGRKTWESIPKKYRPLPQRYNAILSQSYGRFGEIGSIETGLKFGDLESCLNYLYNETGLKNRVEHIFIIGGSQLYNSVLHDERLEKIYLTKVIGDYGCDVFFDGIDENFEKIFESETKKHKDISYSFVVYQRKKST